MLKMNFNIFTGKRTESKMICTKLRLFFSTKKNKKKIFFFSFFPYFFHNASLYPSFISVFYDIFFSRNSRHLKLIYIYIYVCDSVCTSENLDPKIPGMSVSLNMYQRQQVRTKCEGEGMQGHRDSEESSDLNKQTKSTINTSFFPA